MKNVRLEYASGWWLVISKESQVAFMLLLEWISENPKVKIEKVSASHEGFLRIHLGSAQPQAYIDAAEYINANI